MLHEAPQASLIGQYVVVDPAPAHDAGSRTGPDGKAERCAESVIAEGQQVWRQSQRATSELEVLSHETVKGPDHLPLTALVEEAVGR